MSPRYINNRDFPALTHLNHCVTSGQDGIYNCIAWALAGDTARWWWPTPDNPEYYWPEGTFRETPIGSFYAALASLGFEECQNAEHENGYLKVILYVTLSFGQPVPTHAARQRNDGQWTSKLGRLEDITHVIPEAVNGQVYGQPFRCFRRRLEPGEFEDRGCL
jgi:hypothetical protein